MLCQMCRKKIDSSMQGNYNLNCIKCGSALNKHLYNYMPCEIFKDINGKEIYICSDCMADTQHVRYLNKQHNETIALFKNIKI
jgi:DNA-directed RNA polymerase subunit RPC12/RpoP